MVLFRQFELSVEYYTDRVDRKEIRLNMTSAKMSEFHSAI